MEGSGVLAGSRRGDSARPLHVTAVGIDPAAAAKYARQFPKVALFTIDEVFGGWAKAQKTHFADGGTFDRVYLKK
mgnify:CR=1 FL=1